MKRRLSNMSVAYKRFGSGTPIMCLHGFGLDHQSIMDPMERLFHNNRLRHSDWTRYYPDLPGMGKTNGEEWIQSSEDMLSVVLEFIEAMIPKRRFVLAGYSYGAYLARGVLEKRRDWVAGLLLICPVVIADSRKRILPISAQTTKTSTTPPTPDEDQALLDMLVVQSPTTLRRLKKECQLAQKSSDPHFLDKISQQYSFSFEHTLSRRFDGPALVMTGRQDTVVGYEDAWHHFNHFGQSTFMVLDRAGHHLPIEQESVFETAVSEWLDRIKATRLETTIE